MKRRKKMNVNSTAAWRLCLPFVVLAAGASLNAQEGAYNLLFSSSRASVAPGEVVSIGIVMENVPDAVTGFSLGVRHDAASMTLESVELGRDLQAIVEGSCPGGQPDANFFHVNESPEGGDGFTVAMLLTTDQCTGQLVPDVFHDLLRVSYRAAADGVDNSLSFAEDLGSPAVPILFDVAGSAQPRTSPELSEPVFVRVAAPTPFIRGDVDITGGLTATDAIIILNFLFTGGLPAGEATKADCLVAYNVDGSIDRGDPAAEDMADIDLSDAVIMLNFIFGAAPPPAAPYPACGEPEGAVAGEVGCVGFTCP